MKSIAFVATVALPLALAATSALAQQTPAQAASAADGAGMMSRDCAKPMAKTERGAQGDMSSAQTGPCAATPASGVKAKKRPRHDHSKFHKNLG
jgi:Ni/Co efflux regulator RcnB